MRSPLRRLLQRSVLVLSMFVLPSAAVLAQAQAQAPAAAPPSNVVAPAESKADSNAARAKTQPGNNAPFWRGVRGSG